MKKEDKRYWKDLDNARENVLFKFYMEFIIPLFASKGYILPLNVRVSVGLQSHKAAIGSTWHPSVGQGYYHIYIAPKIANSSDEVFATLIHEVIHTMFFNHLKEFSQCAAAVGLVKPWTSTTASPKLSHDIDVWIFDNNIEWHEPKMDPDNPGQNPFDYINPGGGTGPRIKGPLGGPGPQKSRMVKLTCPECGYIIRTARANITKFGFPVCPDGSDFEEK